MEGTLVKIGDFPHDVICSEQRPMHGAPVIKLAQESLGVRDPLPPAIVIDQEKAELRRALLDLDESILQPIPVGEQF